MAQAELLYSSCKGNFSLRGKGGNYDKQACLHAVIPTTAFGGAFITGG